MRFESLPRPTYLRGQFQSRLLTSRYSRSGFGPASEGPRRRAHWPDGLRSTVRRQKFPDVDLVYAGYVAWRGMVEEAALTPSTHAAIFHRFGWGLLDRQHILGYPLGWLSCSAKCPETRMSSAPKEAARLQNPALVPTWLGS